jgi:hypothetical protein
MLNIHIYFLFSSTLLQSSFSNQSLSVAPFLRAPFTFVLDDLLYLPLAPADFLAPTSSFLFSADKLFILAAGKQVLVVPPPFCLFTFFSSSYSFITFPTI